MSKKHYLYATALAFAIVGLGMSDAAYAKKPDDGTVTIVNGADSMDIQWDAIDNAESYTVLYDGNTVVYEGKDTSFKHTNLDKLKQKSVFDYTVLAINSSNEVIAEMKGKAYRLNSQTGLDIKSTVNGKNVKLQWSNTKASMLEYTIYRDGEEVGKTKSSSFVDTPPTLGKHTYRIEATRQYKENDKKPKAESYIITMPVVVSDDKELKKSKKDYVEQSVAISSSWPYATMVRRTTFLYNQYYQDPLNSNYFYGGDNRSYNATANKYRTRLDTQVDWDYTTLSNYFHQWKYVGPTTRYELVNGSYVLKETKTASSSGMSVEIGYWDNSVANFATSHSIGMPFYWSTPPNIDYYTNETWTRDGLTMMSGAHDQCPMFEIYRLDDGSWTTLMLRYGNNLDALWPTYGQSPIDI